MAFFMLFFIVTLLSLTVTSFLSSIKLLLHDIGRFRFSSLRKEKRRRLESSLTVLLSLWLIVSPASAPEGPPVSLYPTAVSTSPPDLDLLPTPPEKNFAVSYGHGTTGDLPLTGVSQKSRSVTIAPSIDRHTWVSRPLRFRYDISVLRCASLLQIWYAGTLINEPTTPSVVASHVLTSELHRPGTSPERSPELSFRLSTVASPLNGHCNSPPAGTTPASSHQIGIGNHCLVSPQRLNVLVIVLVWTRLGLAHLASKSPAVTTWIIKRVGLSTVLHQVNLYPVSLYRTRGSLSQGLLPKSATVLLGSSNFKFRQLRPQLSLPFAGSTVQECGVARFARYYVIAASPSHYAVSSIDGSSQSRLCSPLTPSPHLIATLPKFSISRLYQLLSFRDCTVDDSVCSPTPAASLHSTAMSGDPSIFRDSFQLRSKPIRWVLQRRSRLFGVLSNAGSRTTSEDFLRVSSLLSHIYLSLVLVMLAYQLSVEYLSGCNQFSPAGV
ncbi:unnamed protein product [Brassica rapa subsp. narinosa]